MKPPVSKAVSMGESSGGSADGSTENTQDTDSFASSDTEHSTGLQADSMMWVTTAYCEHRLDMNMVPEEETPIISLDEEESDEKSKSGDKKSDDNSIEYPGESQRVKRKTYHRHTLHQTQRLESFFKDCPNPSDKQRMELSEEVGLEPSQVKFWFQNKRTQSKTQHSRHENSNLRAENEKLVAENKHYKEALSNTICLTCNGPSVVVDISMDEQQLRLENARLKKEIEHMSAEARKREVTSFLGQSRLSSPPHQPNRFRYSEEEKKYIIMFSMSALEELLRMAQMAVPLWIPTLDGNTILNEDEYFQAFRRGFRHRPIGFVTEASKETVVVNMNCRDLVETLMNVNQWASMFSSIVSRAILIETLSKGAGGSYNGECHVMRAEYQMPSPLVKTRESCFARYCERHNDGTWAVVDVSLDDLHINPFAPLFTCRRRPSGCVIQDMSNGSSKVTWIEHVEVHNKGVHHLYIPLVYAGLAFSAKRWLSALERRCERLASEKATFLFSNNINNTVIGSQERWVNYLKLAEKLVLGYWGSMSASTTYKWTTLNGSGEDVRLMIRKSCEEDGLREPAGVVLNAATSIRLPIPPKTVFDLLRDVINRAKWDILCNDGSFHEAARFTCGRDGNNYVSLLRTQNSNNNSMFIIQESYSDPTTSYLVYAPIDITVLNAVLAGGDLDCVRVLPCGFAIVPDGGWNARSSSSSGGTLLTVSLSILVSTNPTVRVSDELVPTANNLILSTSTRVRGFLLSQIA